MPGYLRLLVPVWPLVRNALLAWTSHHPKPGLTRTGQRKCRARAMSHSAAPGSPRHPLPLTSV